MNVLCSRHVFLSSLLPDAFHMYTRHSTVAKLDWCSHIADWKTESPGRL